MIFKNWDAVRRYNADIDSPIFNTKQLFDAGLEPSAAAKHETHTVKGVEQSFYTAEQAVRIAGRKIKPRENFIMNDMDRLHRHIQQIMEAEAPLFDLEYVCNRTQELLDRYYHIKSYFPATDAARRKRLDKKAFELRRFAGEFVKSSAGVAAKYGGNGEMTIDESKMFSAVTVKQITDELVRSFVPDHPKDEFPLARLMKRKVVIHCGETNTGKTYSALQDLKKAKTGVYLAPLRLLALEVFQTLNGGGTPCDLLTGEEKHTVEGATYVSSTIEMMNLDNEYDIALIDEAQMAADPQRGNSWTKAMLGVRARELIICCSNNAVPLITKLIEDCGDICETVQHTRDTPLVFEKKQYVFPADVMPGDALIAFSRRSVLELADSLAACGIEASVIYGALPPDNRRMQMQRFIDGESSVVVATDAIGMGLNLPIKRVVFTQVEKFNGVDIRNLAASEIQQIAGRAGRKNIYDTGYVCSCLSQRLIESGLNAKLPELQHAYYLPIEQYVLKLPLGDLRQRLKACMDSRDISYINKGDLTEPLRLLMDIQKYESLSMREQYRLIFVPFDIKNRGLRAAWRSYVDLYSNGQPIPKPDVEGSHLDDWEYAYKELDLYYSFCSAMEIEINADWVMEKKREVSKEIDRLLLQSLRNSGPGKNDALVEKLYVTHFEGA
jgi:ATP-dependent RNA helicase SUPV3L1/SUV3